MRPCLVLLYGYLFVESSARCTTRSVGGLPSHVGSPFHTAPASDPVDRFFHWFNFERPNMALDTSKRETPIQAFYRLQPRERGTTSLKTWRDLAPTADMPIPAADRAGNYIVHTTARQRHASLITAGVACRP